MAPRKKQSYARPRPEPPEPYIKEGPPVGTLARRMWLEQQAIELLETIKAEVRQANMTPALMSVATLVVVVGDLAEERRDTSR